LLQTNDFCNSCSLASFLSFFVSQCLLLYCISIIRCRNQRRDEFFMVHEKLLSLVETAGSPKKISGVKNSNRIRQLTVCCRISLLVSSFRPNRHPPTSREIYYQFVIGRKEVVGWEIKLCFSRFSIVLEIK
jgi:hypothetical protein